MHMQCGMMALILFVDLCMWHGAQKQSGSQHDSCLQVTSCVTLCLECATQVVISKQTVTVCLNHVTVNLKLQACHARRWG
jgi:hypothetical protein